MTLVDETQAAPVEGGSITILPAGTPYTIIAEPPGSQRMIIRANGVSYFVMRSAVYAQQD